MVCNLHPLFLLVIMAQNPFGLLLCDLGYKLHIKLVKVNFLLLNEVVHARFQPIQKLRQSGSQNHTFNVVWTNLMY